MSSHGDVDLEKAGYGDLSEEELFLAAGSLYDRIGDLNCPRCGVFQARFSRLRLSQGLGLLPRPCCVLGAFSLIPAFEDAWLSLEPTTRPVLVFGTSMAVEQDPGGDEDAKANYRAQMRDLLLGVAQFSPCRRHGADTAVRVEIVHREDPFCEFDVTACCREFERVVGCIAVQFIFESSAGGPPIFYPPD